MLDKRPTAKEWLLDWFSKNDNKISLNDMCFWMPNGLYRHARQLMITLEELNIEFDNDAKYLVYNPTLRGGQQ